MYDKSLQIMKISLNSMLIIKKNKFKFVTLKLQIYAQCKLFYVINPRIEILSFP